MALHRLFDQARQEVDGRMDLVPILDMMISLLIFFVVAASLGQQHALKIQAAKAGHAETAVNQHFILYIDTAGHTLIQGKEIDDQTALQSAQKWIQSHPQSSVIVQADGRAKVEGLIHLIDFLKGGGIKSISLGVQSQKTKAIKP